jgi:PAS domain S-box-containing protein
MNKDELMNRRIEREKSARKQAEVLLERKSLELYQTNQALQEANRELEQRVAARTAELCEANAQLQRDIFQRQRTEQSLIAKEREARLLHRATSMAAETQSFEEAIQQCLELVCDATEWTLGHAYVVDENDRIALLSTGLWHAPNGQLHETFREVTEKTPMRSGVGLPGRVLATGQPAWIVDLREDGNFPRAAACPQIGLRSAFAFPIKVAGQCVAVLEFFREEEAAEDHDLLQLMRSVGEQLGRVLERKRAEQSLRDSEERFRFLSKATNDAIWDWDLITNQLQWSESFEVLFGFSRSEVEPTIDSWTNRVHPDDHARVVTKIHEVIERGAAAWSDEYRFLCKDGHYAYVLDRGYVIHKAAGQPTRMVGAMTDLTERNMAESLREDLSRQLLSTSRRAGMAEVATGVLHNVGNVLNSVNVSANIAADKLRASKVRNLSRAVAMLNDHVADLADFVSNNEKGKQLPAYLVKLAEHLGKEQEEVLNELASLTKNVEHIKQVVAMQQSHARVAGVTEMIAAQDLIEESLRLNLSSFERHHIRVTREYAELPPLMVDKHKAIQILVNLVSNVRHALDGNALSNRQVTLRTRPSEVDPQRVRLQVIDNGMGITPENLTNVFLHGFTTRNEGHGFGLHTAALAAKDLGGSLTVHSDGPGKGATFTLELPLTLAEVQT